MGCNSQDTIVAIATANGIGAVGLVRLSGSDATTLADQLFVAINKKPLAEFQERYLVLGHLQYEGQMLDQALAVVMRAPRSYTGEEVVELHCHGGPLLLQLVLEALLAGGARLAEPGEFTRRAFLNGRLDLTQAEAVNNLIEARSLQALRVSVNQLRGRLRQDIQVLKELLLSAATYVAASIDFSDESDVNFSHDKEIKQRLEEAQSRLLAITKDAPKRKMIFNGINVVIVGAPNVGKSSLLNALLAEERAIVTSQPGTTRDTIEETISIGGLSFTLIDTAGIRNTKCKIEQAGIQRSEKAIQSADILLLVLDGATGLSRYSEQLLKKLEPSQTIALINKKDIALPTGPPWQAKLKDWQHIFISALRGDGIKQLQKQLAQFANDQTKLQYEHPMLTNARQEQAAKRALKAVQQALQNILYPAQQALLAEDINQALHDLSSIVGDTTTEDILNQVFSRFCIGK